MPAVATAAVAMPAVAPIETVRFAVAQPVAASIVVATMLDLQQNSPKVENYQQQQFVALGLEHNHVRCSDSAVQVKRFVAPASGVPVDEDEAKWLVAAIELVDVNVSQRKGVSWQTVAWQTSAGAFPTQPFRHP